MLGIGIMFFSQFTPLGGQALNHLTDQKARTLVERHQRIIRVIGLGVEVKQVFHAGKVLGVYLAYAPLAFEVGLEFIFLG